jgi:biopolymer transport protein TolR
VFLGETEIAYAELKDKLTTNERLKREKELYLHADRVLPYGYVVDIMAIIKDAGVENLGMVTDPMGVK